MLINILFISLISIILHELGHLIAIIMFNIVSKRTPFDFKIHFSVWKISISHLLYCNKIYNALVALAGPIFPILISFIIVRLQLFEEYSGQLFLVSLLHAIFLLPIFPDGRNIRKNLMDEVI